jgi:hypothetical protein
MESTKTPGNGYPPKTRHQPRDPLGEVGARLQALASKTSIQDLREKLDVSRHLKTNPYGTLAVALGAGYVLGGGLFSSTTRRVLGVGLKVGLRLGAIAFLKQQLSLLANGTTDRKNRNHTNTQGAQS